VGYVGIGTDNPSATLHIQGATPIVRINDFGSPYFTRLTQNGVTFTVASGVSNGVIAVGGAGTGALNLQTNAASTGIRFLTSNTEYMRLTVSGSLGIGTSTPQANLDVSGTIRHTGILIDASDRRLKSNIRQLPTSLESMMKLNPVSFTMNDNPTQTELGFIAQDVQPLFPTLVVIGNDPSKTLSLNYPGFIAPMVKAMQELKADKEPGM
jgi:hypothetical protein